MLPMFLCWDGYGTRGISAQSHWAGARATLMDRERYALDTESEEAVAYDRFFFSDSTTKIPNRGMLIIN